MDVGIAPYIFYYLGAFLILAWNFARYVVLGVYNHKRTWKTLMFEWIFKPAKTTTIPTSATQLKASWITTVGVVWMLGGYLVGLYGNALPFGPENSMFIWGFMFTAGSLAEAIAPPLAKKLMGFLTSIKFSN